MQVQGNSTHSRGGLSQDKILVNSLVREQLIRTMSIATYVHIRKQTSLLMTD